ncbi:hypothetical protein PR048_031502 [Dryococelus australis]|uniref:Uncharacterized protein n=1 Tax=Dryococelus australis TaxID=614101 RepID=A0ABQ9G5G5_9NEOP|nr:hypothetical protein PR048_031502 [Dryococelus australis]
MNFLKEIKFYTKSCDFFEKYEVLNLFPRGESIQAKVEPLMSAVSSAIAIRRKKPAERTGDWNLNLFSVQRILAHLHAVGHIHYAKSAHLYLQNMSKLKTILSDQESERFVSGGLTQDRNMSRGVVAGWICTMPGSLHVTEAVEAFAGVTDESSQQHLSLSRSLQTQDTRIVADDRVNCDSAEELGENAVGGIVGIPFANVTLKRKMQVFTLTAMGKPIKIDKDPVVVNPNQLFHRIACVVRSADELEDCLQYELASYPQSLFDDVGLHVGTKSKTIQVTDNMCKISSKLPENPSYVLDGGDLLHRVHWPRPATYGEVCNTYLNYINRNYGRNVTVVFDGYEPIGGDPDLLVLIAALTQPQCAMYMIVLGNSTTARKIYCSREIHKGLGNMTKHLFFLNAFMGCNTTSALYKRGPISRFNELKNDCELLKVVDIFNNPNASQDCVAAAGEQFIINLYGGKRSEGLDKTRYKKYVQTVVKDWGCTVEQGQYKPVTSTLPPAPATCCISYVMGAKETAPEIVSASEAG